MPGTVSERGELYNSVSGDDDALLSLRCREGITAARHFIVLSEGYLIKVTKVINGE
jgi:hypothetical protein